MRIESSEIPNLALPHEVVVLTQRIENQQYRFDKLTRSEIRVLAKHNAIFITISPKQQIVRHATLMVSTRRAKAILGKLAPVSCGSFDKISKPRNQSQKMHWAPRFDKAKSGFSAHSRTLSAKQQSQQEYSERMESVRRIQIGVAEGLILGSVEGGV